jgi:hypothetical protein
LIHSLEFLSFTWKLFHNVCRVENRLQIHVLTLCFGPHFKDVRNQFYLLVPVQDLLFKGLFIGGELHCLGVYDVFVQNLVDFVVVFNDVSNFEGNQFEIDVCPDGLHRGQHRFYLKLLGRFLPDVHAILNVLHQT